MKMQFMILLAGLLFYSCTPESPIPNPCKLPDCSDTIKPKEVKLELLWQRTLREDNEYTPLNRTCFVAKNIVFLYDYVDSEKVLFVNKEDSTTQRFKGAYGGLLDRFYHSGVGLVTLDYKSVFVGKDALNMKKIASAPACTQFTTLNNLIGDYLYLTSVRNDCKEETYVLKINVYSGDIIYDKIQKDADYPGISVNSIDAPGYFNFNNDTLLIYAKYVNVNDKPYITLETYKDGNLMWIDSNFVTNSLQGYLIEYNGKAITYGKNFNLIDPLTGQIFWKTPYISGRDWKGWLTSNLILIDNKVCFLEQGHYVEINADNGKILYDSPEIYSAQTASDMTYFEGVFYWTASEGAYSYIFGLRVSDRKVVLKMKSPNQGKAPYYNDTNYSTNRLIIDPVTRLGYTADGFFAQCFRIPTSYK